MTDAERKECHAIIHTASVGAGAIGGGTFISCADAIPITAAQVTMIISLSGVFGTTISRTAAEAMWKSFWVPFVGRNIAQAFMCLIPGIGNATNAATAAMLTEYIGWDVAKQFDKERGKTFYNVKF